MKNPKIKSGVYIRELKNEKAIYDKQTGNVHFINPTASFIFDLCDGNHSKEDIIAQLQDNYDVSRETATKDVEDVLNDLKEKEILEDNSRILAERVNDT